MPSSSKVLGRMDRRVAELASGFEKSVRRFGASGRFTGPSWYFHRRTLDRRSKHRSMASPLADDAFFDALYATLTAWGLHRMGPGNTRLRDLDEIRESVRRESSRLDHLARFDITEAGQSEAGAVVEEVWSVLSRLKVSVATAKIVANSKALHHLLPRLVPPVDRQYTCRFFYGRTALSVDEPTAFREMYSRLLQLASRRKRLVDRMVGGEWNTSPAKVVDNAIVGYMIARERRAG
jgi:hypothetical protein